LGKLDLEKEHAQNNVACFPIETYGSCPKVTFFGGKKQKNGVF